MEAVILDLGSKERSVGFTYCGMSRCKSLDQLAFDSGPPESGMPSFERLTSYYSYKYFKATKSEEKRLDALAKKTLEDYEQERLMAEMDIDNAYETEGLSSADEQEDQLEIEFDYDCEY